MRQQHLVGTRRRVGRILVGTRPGKDRVRSAARDLHQPLDLEVMGFEVLVAQGPVLSDAIERGKTEIVGMEPRHLAPPTVGVPAEQRVRDELLGMAAPVVDPDFLLRPHTVPDLPLPRHDPAFLDDQHPQPWRQAVQEEHGREAGPGDDHVPVGAPRGIEVDQVEHLPLGYTGAAAAFLAPAAGVARLASPVPPG